MEDTIRNPSALILLKMRPWANKIMSIVIHTSPAAITASSSFCANVALLERILPRRCI